MNPARKTRRRFGSIDDKPVGNSALAPPRLFPVWNGIHLPPGRTLLVRRGNRPPADACRRRGLPVPRLSAEGGGGKPLRTTQHPRRSPLDIKQDATADFGDSWSAGEA